MPPSEDKHVSKNEGQENLTSMKTGEFDRLTGNRGKKPEKITYRTNSSRWGYRPESDITGQ